MPSKAPTGKETISPRNYRGFTLDLFKIPLNVPTTNLTSRGNIAGRIQRKTLKLHAMLGKAAIITRTKNRPNFLRRAMLSALGQTYSDWIHVIVNDGGKRSEIDLLGIEFEDAYKGRLQILHLPESIGMQSASNAAIEASESDYIIIHDDDDSLHPNYLKKTIQFLSEAGSEDSHQGVVSQTWRVDEDINAYGDFQETGRSHFMPLKFVSIQRFGGENPFPPIAFLYRREAHQEIGLFNQRYNVLGDWDFHYRFIQKYDIGVLDQKLANYHWRVGTQPEGFSNTVTTGVEEHHMQLNKLHNDYIRKHIQEQPNTIPPIMSLGRELHQTKQQLQLANHQITETKKELKGLIKELRAIQKKFAWLLTVKATSSVQPQHATLYKVNQHPQPQRLDHAKYLKTAQSRKLISFDIFDTCLLRATQRPVDVFLIVESLTDITRNNEPIPFARARELAERRSRQNATNGETTFDAIHAELAALLKLSPEEANAVRELELKVERQVLYPNKIVHQLYSELKQTGKRIIFISDMYFPEPILRELLETNGYEADEIYVSCDHAASKHDGTLYDLVLSQEGVQGADVLHFGDNYRSDIEQAQQRGLKTGYITEAHLPQTYFRNSPKPQRYAANRDLSCCAIGLAQQHRLSANDGNEDYWQTFGYEIAGPLYFFYTKWLIEQAKHSGRHQLVFLARDGYYLQRAFELIDASWNTGLKSQYLFASRRLFNLAAITELDDDAFAFLTTPNPNMQVRDFLSRLNFDPEQYRTQVQQAGLSSLNEVVTKHNGTFKSTRVKNQIHALLRNLSSEIKHKAEAERALLFDYFDSAALDAEKSLFVDVGWQASSIKSLSRLLSLKNNTSTNLAGCFFGTWHFAQPVVDAGHDIRSFFHHLNEPDHRIELIKQSVSVIESLFSAPHPTIIGIEKQNAEWKAIYGANPDQETCNRRLDRIWQGAEQFIQDMLPLSSQCSTDDGIELLESLLTRVLQHPTEEDALALGSIQHRESFGNPSASPIVSPIPRSTNLKALQAGLQHSNWKQGYHAQLSRKQQQRLASNPSQDTQTKKPVPWHKHVYRNYRRLLGDPRYCKQ